MFVLRDQYLCVTLLYIVIGIVPTQCRRYDVEAESVKLYGEDLPAVLSRFRRSPEYVSVLTDRLEVLKQHYEQVSAKVIYYFLEKLKQRVAEQVTPTSTPADFSGYATSPATVHYRGPPSLQRRWDDEVDNSTVSTHNPIDALESYAQHASSLSAAQRNGLKDLGFEYVGHAIHAVIKHMGPDNGGAVLSTRLPGGGEPQPGHTPTTTEHVMIHEVTTASVSTAHGPAGHSQGTPVPHVPSAPPGARPAPGTRFRASTKHSNALGTPQ